MTEVEIRRRYDRVLLPGQDVSWRVKIRTVTVLAEILEYQFVADFLAETKKWSINNVTVAVRKPLSWPREKVLKRLLQRLVAGKLAENSTIEFNGNQT